MEFIEQVELFGLGIGYMDAQLLAATRLTIDAQFWTLDWRLRAAAERYMADVEASRVTQRDYERWLLVARKFLRDDPQIRRLSANQKRN